VEALQEWDATELDERLVAAGMPVLVFFRTRGHPSTQVLDPVLAALAKEFHGRAAFAQVNVTNAAQHVGALPIAGTPTVAVFDGRTLIDQRTGMAPLRVYRDMLERALIAYTA
jgi:thioredoxin-like negative regulator of GroEL